MSTVEGKLESGEDQVAVLTNLDDLSEFKLEKILFNNTNRKTICMQGTFNGNKQVGLVLLEKTAFTQDQFEENCDYFDKKCILKKLFDNDIYGNYQYFPTIDLNAIKATIIYPATEKHIRKFTVQNIYIVDETPELYKEVILPHLTEEHFDLQWVYNILERKSEAERICCEDTDPNVGFTLIPDLKWDGITLDTLYFLAITRLRDLKSLRDLTADHLPLLKNIYTKGTEAIELKYGLDPSQLRIYFHYQPSFYHLHVHFTYLKHEAPGILAERAHLLTQVISNLELLPDYYQRVNLPFVVRESDNLFKKLEAKGVLKKLQPKAEIGDVISIALESQHFSISTRNRQHKYESAYFKILKDSLSDVRVTTKSLAFRFLIDNHLPGSQCSKMSFTPVIEIDDLIFKNVPFLIKDSPYNIECSSCQQVLSKDIKFDTILPLSDELETDTLFDNVFRDTRSCKVPKPTEVYYFDCFAQINEHVLCGATVDDNSSLLCSKCEEWIGVRLKSGINKIWFNTVTFTGKCGCYYTDSLDDVISTIRRTFNSKKFVSSKKLVISYNGSESFLLLWVIEDRLHLQSLDFDGFVAKVLFKILKADNSLVCEWLNNSNVCEVDVSKTMFMVLSHHLKDINYFIPSHMSELNGFNVSYLGKN